MKLKKRLGVVMILAMLVSMFAMTLTANAAKLNKKKATVGIGSTVKLQVNGTKKKVKWSSSNKSIATVSKKGVVKGKKKGTAKITATVGKNKYTCKVTVKKPKLSFPDKLKDSDFDIQSGGYGTSDYEYGMYEPGTVNLNAYLKKSPSNIQVKWSSSDNSIATVKDGIVSGLRYGKVRITAKSGPAKASVMVYINEAVENEKKVEVTPKNFSKYFEKVEYTVYRPYVKDASYTSRNYGYPSELPKRDAEGNIIEGETDTFDGMETHVAYLLKNADSFDLTKSVIGGDLYGKAMVTPYYVTLNGSGYTLGEQVKDTATSTDYVGFSWNDGKVFKKVKYGTDKDGNPLFEKYSDNVAGKTLIGFFDDGYPYTYSYADWDNDVNPRKFKGNVTKLSVLSTMTINGTDGIVLYKK